MNFDEQKQWLSDNGFERQDPDVEFAYSVIKPLSMGRALHIWRMEWHELWAVGIEDTDSSSDGKYRNVTGIFYDLPTDIDFNSLQPIFEKMNFKQDVYGK